MSVFKQCKDKSLVSLIGASDSYCQGVQNLVMGFMAGVNGPHGLSPLNAAYSFNSLNHLH